MPDIAKLGLEIDATGTVRASKELDKLTAAGARTEKAYQNVERTARASGQAQATAMQKSAQDQVAAMQRVEAQQARVGVAARKAGGGFDSMKESVSSLAAQMTGVHPVFGRLASVVGQFAMGSGLMIGALAGIAALGYAWQKIMAPINEAKKAAEEALSVLDRVRDAKYNNLTRDFDNALVEGEAKKAKLRKDIELYTVLAGNGSTGYSLEQLQKAQREYAELSSKMLETERERARVLAESAKKTADEFKKAEEERARAAKEAAAKVIAAAKEEQEALNELMAQRQRQVRVDLYRSRSGTTVAGMGGGTGGLVYGPSLSADLERQAAEIGLVASKAALVMQEVWTEAIRGVQRSFADGFVSILSDGLNGFKSFGRSLVDLFRDVAAQIAAAMAVKKLGIDKALDAIKGGGGLGSAFGALSGVGKVAGVAGVGLAVFDTVSSLVGKLSDSLFGHAKKMREASDIVAENMRRMAASVAEARRSYGLSTPFSGGMDPLESELRGSLDKLSAATFGGLSSNGVPFSQLPLDELMRLYEQLKATSAAGLTGVSDFERLIDAYLAAVKRSADEVKKAAQAERERADAIAASEAAARAAEEARRAEDLRRQEQDRLAQRQSGADSLALRRLGLGATSEESIRARAAILGGQELAEAQKLVAQGVYTTDMFRDLANILDGELAQALEAFRKSVLEAGDAAAAEAAAKAQQQMGWGRDLDIEEALIRGDKELAEKLRMNKEFDDFYNQLVKQGASGDILNRWLVIHNQRMASLGAGVTDVAEVSRAMGTTGRDEVLRSAVSMTETTALRLVDYSASQLSELRRANAFLARIAGGSTIATAVDKSLGNNTERYERQTGQAT